MSGYRVVSISPRRWHDPWDMFDLLTPSRIFDQNFGLGLTDDDIAPSSLYPGMYLRARQFHSPQARGRSEVTSQDNKFQVNLDVNQFSPNELTVKTVDQSVVIHGKHEEKMDEHGYISREFTRRYMLPEGVESDQVVSSLSKDGVLTIEAPLKALDRPESNERVVPIQQKEPTVAINEETKK